MVQKKMDLRYGLEMIKIQNYNFPKPKKFGISNDSYKNAQDKLYTLFNKRKNKSLLILETSLNSAQRTSLKVQLTGLCRLCLKKDNQGDYQNQLLNTESSVSQTDFFLKQRNGELPCSPDDDIQQCNTHSEG